MRAHTELSQVKFFHVIFGVILFCLANTIFEGEGGSLISQDYIGKIDTLQSILPISRISTHFSDQRIMHRKTGPIFLNHFSLL